MKKQNVYDPLISKRQQYLLATQVCVPSAFLFTQRIDVCSSFCSLLGPF